MALGFRYTTASFNPRRISVTSYCDSDLIKDLSGPLSLYCNKTALTFIAASSRRERRMDGVDVTGGELSLVINWGYRSVESWGLGEMISSHFHHQYPDWEFLLNC